jgi:integrase
MQQLSIGRLRGGFCVYWREPGSNKRRRHQLAARTRAEAEAEALDIFRRETFTHGEVTVADIWNAYCDDLGDRPTAKTMRYTGKSVLATFGHYRPDQITTDLCRRYFADRTTQGVSQGTVHTELGHLRSAMNFAEKQGLIDKAPHIERPSKPTPRERYLDTAEVRRLLDAASAPHIQLAIQLLL